MRAALLVILLAIGPAHAEPAGRLVECNYDLVIINRDDARFDLDLRPSVRWRAFRVPRAVRRAADDARARGCTVYAFLRSTDGAPSPRDHESVLVTCSRPTRTLKRAGYWFVPSAEITTRTGNEKSAVAYAGSAWLWPRPRFDDLGGDPRRR